jgi:hypothetical protein
MSNAGRMQMERTITNLGAAEELLGSMFINPKELRHLAERSLGHDFIPVELLHEDDRAADLVLRPSGMGQIYVHAERERHWYPFQITRVDHVGD